VKNIIQRVRENLGLTQCELSDLLNIPVKSIRNWEQNLRKPSNYILELIVNTSLKLTNEHYLLKNNENQVLSFLTIKEKVTEVVKRYNINKVYLYGSYAKGLATPNSDIDLYMISEIDGLDYFGIIEDLRNSLNKKIDLLSNKTIKKGSSLESEINKTRILIYER